ncbi:MAG: rod shape-determining protein MreD [Pseudomonadota bacterium]
MVIRRHHSGWIIIASFVVALLLGIVIMPAWTALFRPEWAAMVLIYWCLALPHRINVGYGWLAGLCVDVLSGALLGQHALGFAVIAYLVVKLHQRLRVFPVWQQALSVTVFVALEQLLVLWVQGMIGLAHESWTYWLPSIVSGLLWPWTFWLLRRLRRRFRVS